MKIIVQRPVAVDIGPLDHALQLPMASRIRHGIKTICDACRKPITDAYFVAGFKQGHRNMMFHESCAVDGGVTDIVSAEERRRDMDNLAAFRADMGAK